MGASKKVPYRGKVYSVASLAKELGVGRDTLAKYINKGMTPEEFLRTRKASCDKRKFCGRSIKIHFRGDTLSQRQMAIKYGVDPYTFRRRLKENWTVEEALGLKVHTIKRKGNRVTVAIRQDILEKLDAEIGWQAIPKYIEDLITKDHDVKSN